MTELLTAFTRSKSEFQSWGSEGRNPAFGYSERPKHRWRLDATRYQDIAALERFGVDPLKPAGHGIVMNANSYGYQIDGFTTGYTVKLPPPADPVAAQRTPRSGNQPAIIGVSDGSDEPAVGTVPSDEPSAIWENPAQAAVTRAANIKEGRSKLLEQDSIFAATYGDAALNRRQAFLNGTFAGGLNHNDPGIPPFG
jgi:hypothetical protein